MFSSRHVINRANVAEIVLKREHEWRQAVSVLPKIISSVSANQDVHLRISPPP
jgi:hypothetical protein